MPKLNNNIYLKKKKHILETALRLFETNGYQKTSINEIVKEANISKGNFYTYFDSKQALFLEIIFQSDQIKTSFDVEGTTQKERLMDYVRTRLEFLNNKEGFAKVAFEFWTVAEKEDLYETIKDRYKGFEEHILSLLDAQDNRENIAYILLSLIDGIIYMSLIMGNHYTENDLVVIMQMISNLGGTND